MTNQSSKDTMNQIIDEILSEMPLKEQVSIANMSESSAEALQQVFGLYIRSRADDSEDVEFQSIMKELWKRLRATHRFRIVRQNRD
jgi:hypothetical protein